MKTLSDTHPRMAEKQFELLRLASVAKRLQRARSLSSTVILLSRKAMAKANPDWSESELQMAWVASCYGADLAEKLQTFLDGIQK